jgi:hypothetical protein
MVFGRRLLAAFAVGGASFAFGACSLLTNIDGLTNPDGALADAATDIAANDAFVALDCGSGAQLDTTCVATVPAGWTPTTLAGLGVSTCPPGFETTPYVTNPEPALGACVCSCSTTGAWTCAGKLGSGSSCTADMIAASSSSCWNVSHTSLGEFIDRSGTVSCGGGNQIGTGLAVTFPLTLCTPKQCSVDYCGTKDAGYGLCIANPATTSCPVGFPVRYVAGTSAKVACDPCPTCTVANADAGCSGSVTAYSTLDCNGNVLGGTSTNDTCASTIASFLSIYFDAAPPPVPSCVAGSTGPGTTSLDDILTICCTN